MPCEHENFEAVVNVGRLTDEAGKVSRFMAEVHVKCAACGTPFLFKGVGFGCHLEGAAMSVDRRELRIAVEPEGETLPAPPPGPLGFRIRAETFPETAKIIH